MTKNKPGGAEFHARAEVEGDVVGGDKKVYTENFIMEIGDEKIPFDQKIEEIKQHIKDIGDMCEHYQLVNDPDELREWSLLHDKCQQVLKSLYERRLQEIERATEDHEPLNKLDSVLRTLGWRLRRR